MNDIPRAVALLRQGELVALPTETVYGLGADALNPAAVAKIFAAKGARPITRSSSIWPTPNRSSTGPATSPAKPSPWPAPSGPARSP
jgi:hypothetical protein